MTRTNRAKSASRPHVAAMRLATNCACPSTTAPKAFCSSSVGRSARFGCQPSRGKSSAWTHSWARITRSEPSDVGASSPKSAPKPSTLSGITWTTCDARSYFATRLFTTTPSAASGFFPATPPSADISATRTFFTSSAVEIRIRGRRSYVRPVSFSTASSASVNRTARSFSSRQAAAVGAAFAFGCATGAAGGASSARATPSAARHRTTNAHRERRLRRTGPSRPAGSSCGTCPSWTRRRRRRRRRARPCARGSARSSPPTSRPSRRPRRRGCASRRGRGSSGRG